MFFSHGWVGGGGCELVFFLSRGIIIVTSSGGGCHPPQELSAKGGVGSFQVLFAQPLSLGDILLESVLVKKG